MKVNFRLLTAMIMVLPCPPASSQKVLTRPDTLRFKPFIWKSEVPADCPFELSDAITAIGFLGYKSGYHYGDTWYPAWGSNDTLYSPWTDGVTSRADGYEDESSSGDGPFHNETGQGVIVGMVFQKIELLTPGRLKNFK
jgi:hypothetical protein